MALQREKRQVKPPGDWWILPREPTPAILSESEELEDGNDQEQSDSDNSKLYVSEGEDEEHSDEFAGAAHDLDPKSLRQALARSDGNKWQEAAKLEMDSHASNGTWELVDLPPGAKTIGCGWVF